MSLSLQDLGSIGELVGAIGVVITLIYLAHQIRQNTHQLEQSTLAARAAAQNASNVALRETRASIYASAEMTQIFLKGNANPSNLDDVSIARFRLTIQNVTDVMLEIHSQTLATGFSPETWHTQGVTLVRRILDTPGGQWFWASFRDNYPSEFRAEVDRILGESASASASASEAEADRARVG